MRKKALMTGATRIFGDRTWNQWPEVPYKRFSERGCGVRYGVKNWVGSSVAGFDDAVLKFDRAEEGSLTVSVNLDGIPRPKAGDARFLVLEKLAPHDPV